MLLHAKLKANPLTFYLKMRCGSKYYYSLDGTENLAHAILINYFLTGTVN